MKVEITIQGLLKLISCKWDMDQHNVSVLAKYLVEEALHGKSFANNKEYLNQKTELLSSIQDAVNKAIN